ncbi:hypothetical protein TSOC_004103 [Tetrabaena socialis]|uniref:Uncharacterized protein n=1 Tax=Tetrabaena socialis TaxID=47790 RepID=A0A2J8A9V1_9CHLO|nr:hypothetical protein TSOC_004103 [Tetrabaena socialis]|eukprot:PNH09308.1 hypothetical protein TSOC_004103 [Tetrabaena socialis]
MARTTAAINGMPDSRSTVSGGGVDTARSSASTRSLQTCSFHSSGTSTFSNALPSIASPASGHASCATSIRRMK